MRLIIRRDQASKIKSPIGMDTQNLMLSCRVELAPAEDDLIRGFKAENYILIEKVEEGRRVPWITVSDLVNGRTFECEDVATLLEEENYLKEACKDLKKLLLILNTFGTEEIFEL